jgi:hypothetical protein
MTMDKPCFTVCRSCREWCDWVGDRPFCNKCLCYCRENGMPARHPRVYSTGLCMCGALLYPWELGGQSYCRACGRWQVLPTFGKLPTPVNQMITLVGRVSPAHQFGLIRRPQEPAARNARTAVLRDLYRLVIPDIRFLRSDLPSRFYAPWHDAFVGVTNAISQSNAYDRLVAYTKS